MAKPKTLKEIVIGPKRLTKYERARIIGARALQLSMGAIPLIPIEELEARDPLVIAEEELKRGALPISIRRTLPDGRFQVIPLSWLLEYEERVFGV